MKNRRFARARLAGLLAALVWGMPALALAQEFEKVTGPLREEIPARPLVGAAYGFIWIALLAYVVVVAGGIGRVRKELADLRAKVDRATERDGSGAGPRP